MLSQHFPVIALALVFGVVVLMLHRQVSSLRESVEMLAAVKAPSSIDFSEVPDLLPQAQQQQQQQQQLVEDLPSNTQRPVKGILKKTTKQSVESLE